jgi:hypothetical protein
LPCSALAPPISITLPNAANNGLVSLENIGAATASTQSYYTCHTCSIKDGNTYIYYDTIGRIIATIEDINNGTSLEGTEVCIGYDYNAPATPTTADVDTVPTALGPQPYLPRSWTIVPVNSSPAIVTLYFTKKEYEALQNKADGTVYEFSEVNQLAVTKYSGSPEGGGRFIAPASPDGLVMSSAFDTTTGNKDYKVTFTVNSFSTCYVHPTILGRALPIVLSSFTGKHNAIKQINELIWTTQTEINTAKFEIEKSLDLQHWTLTGSVPAKGSTTDMGNYHFDDLNPATGNNIYYRLKMIDNDGSFEYSWIVPINVSASGSNDNGITQIFPNPTQGTLNVWLMSSKEQTAVFNVYDVLGRNVMKTDKNLAAGINNLAFNVGSLAGGTYILNYIDTNGELHYEKFVKE